MLKRKNTIILITAAIISVFVIAGLVYFSIFKKSVEESPISEEKTLEEKLQSLTAPVGEAPEVSEEVIESLSAPGGGGEVSEDVLKSLTAPQ